MLYLVLMFHCITRVFGKLLTGIINMCWSSDMGETNKWYFEVYLRAFTWRYESCKRKTRHATYRSNTIFYMRIWYQYLVCKKTFWDIKKVLYLHLLKLYKDIIFNGIKIIRVYLLIYESKKTWHELYKYFNIIVF